MIDVSEHGDDRRPRAQQFGFVFFLLDDDFVAGFFDDRVKAELARDGRGLFARDVLVDRRHRAHAEELFDDVGCVDDHRGGEFLHGQDVGDFDRFEFGRRRLNDAVDHAAALALTLLLEQHLRLAVFLRLVAVARIAALAGASAAACTGRRVRALARRQRRAGAAAAGTRGEGTRRCTAAGKRAEDAVAGGAAHRGAVDGGTGSRRGAGTDLIALAGDAHAGARRNAGTAGDTADAVG